jgi:hypothetical protein
MKHPIPNGTKVSYSYLLGLFGYGKVEKVSGTGVVLNDNPIIGTDRGYAVRCDDRQEVIYVRQHDVRALEAA